LSLWDQKKPYKIGYQVIGPVDACKESTALFKDFSCEIKQSIPLSIEKNMAIKSFLLENCANKTHEYLSSLVSEFDIGNDHWKIHIQLEGDESQKF
jgi:hypothetical protein